MQNIKPLPIFVLTLFGLMPGPTTTISEATSKRPSVFLEQTTHSHQANQLARLLSQRGYKICQKSTCVQHKTIQIKIADKGRVWLKDTHDKRLFRIPENYKQNALRVRAIATFVQLFQEMRNAKNAEPAALPAFRPPPLPRKTTKKPKPIKQATPKKPVVRRPVTRRQPVPPPTRRKIIKPRLKQQPKVRASVNRRKDPPNRQPAPTMIKPIAKRKPAKPRKPQTKPRRVAKTGLGTQSKPQPKPSPNWFDVQLGAVGGMQDTSTFPLGAHLGIAGGFGWAGIQLTAQYQTLLTSTNTSTHMGLVSLSALWNPIRSRVSWAIGVGGTIELLNVAIQPINTLQTFQIRGGVHLTTRLSFRLFSRFSLFLQPTLFFFPQTYTITYQGDQLLSLTSWRGDLVLGMSWSFL